MTVEWKSADDVVARLGEEYMRKLIANMPMGSTARLGLTGTGNAPNYQIEHEGQPVRMFNGRSHKAWAGAAEMFAEDRLSQQFSKAELTAPFVRSFRDPKGMPRIGR